MKSNTLLGQMPSSLTLLNCVAQNLSRSFNLRHDILIFLVIFSFILLSETTTSSKAPHSWMTIWYQIQTVIKVHHLLVQISSPTHPHTRLHWTMRLAILIMTYHSLKDLPHLILLDNL